MDYKNHKLKNRDFAFFSYGKHHLNNKYEMGMIAIKN